MNTPDLTRATPTPARATAVTAATLAALAALAGALLAASLAAHAAAPQEASVSVAVRVAELNLESAAGTRVMYQRLSAAARQVCGRAEVRELREWALIDACYQRALADAVGSVRNERLSALLASQHGRGVS